MDVAGLGARWPWTPCLLPNCQMAQQGMPKWRLSYLQQRAVEGTSVPSPPLVGERPKGASSQGTSSSAP